MSGSAMAKTRAGLLTVPAKREGSASCGQESARPFSSCHDGLHIPPQTAQHREIRVLRNRTRIGEIDSTFRFQHDGERGEDVHATAPMFG